MGKKVRCKFCIFENKGKCRKKNATVNLNKKRTCFHYVGDEEKIINFAEKKTSKSKPEAILRPDWWWDRAARRRERDRMLENVKPNSMPLPDSRHPKTGDLSRFVSTAVED